MGNSVLETNGNEGRSLYLARSPTLRECPETLQVGHDRGPLDSLGQLPTRRLASHGRAGSGKNPARGLPVEHERQQAMVFEVRRLCVDL